MVNNQLKRLIENALDKCDNFKLQNVRSHLLRALSEISDMERKNQKKKKEETQHGWKFDLATGTLKNLSDKQRNTVLQNIDRMIEEEASKKEPRESSFLSE